MLFFNAKSSRFVLPWSKCVLNVLRWWLVALHTYLVAYVMSTLLSPSISTCTFIAYRPCSSFISQNSLKGTIMVLLLFKLPFERRFDFLLYVFLLPLIGYLSLLCPLIAQLFSNLCGVWFIWELILLKNNFSHNQCEFSGRNILLNNKTFKFLDVKQIRQLI
jgi:hypothetical protein